jgi:tetratricopeptide (TPR) repeat protein
MQGFAEYARYLQQPLTLIGFGLLLLFGVHRTLLRSGIIPPVSARSGSIIVRALLRYGFIIALATIILGFALEFFKTSHQGLTPDDVSRVTTTLTNYFVRSKQQEDAVYLNSVSDQERANAANSIREIESIMSNSGIKLSPEEWTGLGYAYLTANEMDKSKSALLEAVHENPSLLEANYLLSTLNQIQASESLVQGDLPRTRELLKAAEQYGEAARHGHEADSGVGDQLGFIYKQLAQEDLTRHDQDRATEELDKARALFQMGLGVNPNDASAHNGLGTVYYLQGDLDRAIAEQEKAVSLQPQYTYAWHDLALLLVDKYRRDKHPDRATLHRLNAVLDKVFELQATEGAQKLPPEHLKLLEQTRSWARAEAGIVPEAAADALNTDRSPPTIEGSGTLPRPAAQR